MKKFRSITAGLALGTAAFAPLSEAKATEQWDLLTYLPVTSTIYEPLFKFADDVEAQTNGEVVITIRAPGELPYSPAEFHRAVGSGEVAMADTAFISSDAPAAGILTLPLLVQNADEMAKAIKNLRPEIGKELEVYGVELLAWFTYAPTLLWGNGDPADSVADLRGLKVRTLNPEVSGILTNLGAVPITIASPEVMSAVQYGTVNAILTANYGLTFAGWISSFEWGYDVKFSMTPTFLIVNEEKLSALSPENHEIIRKLAAEYENYMVDYSERLEAEALNEVNAAGLTINRVSDEDRTKMELEASEIWEDWAERRGGTTQDMLTKVRTTLDR